MRENNWLLPHATYREPVLAIGVILRIYIGRIDVQVVHIVATAVRRGPEEAVRALIARRTTAGTAITKAQILAHVWGADAELVNEDLKILTPRMKNLTFKKKIILSQKIKINREDFMQIFSILMDSAIKYAGSKIYLELGEHELIVKNDGATIPKEALPHIFERFYQVDKTANGVGLGLAIAKSLAERNHWELTASSESQKICFKLSF